MFVHTVFVWVVWKGLIFMLVMVLGLSMQGNLRIKDTLGQRVLSFIERFPFFLFFFF